MFKHTFATELHENGVDISIIQKLLGHEHVQTTMQIYMHPSEKVMNKHKKKLALGENYMNQKKTISSHSKDLFFKRIDEELTGYWSSDKWDVRLCPVLKGTWKRNYVYLKFEIIKQPVLRNEIKYYFYKRLVEFSISPKTTWRGYVINDLGHFFEQQYPSIVSITDVDKEVLLNKYKKHLIKHGKPLKKNGTNINSDFVSTLIKLYDYYFSYYDEREEIKDIWDINKLNIQFNQSFFHMS